MTILTTNAQPAATGFSPWRLDATDTSRANGRFVSAFACGGGSSMGYMLAGFRSVGFCDIDPSMAQLYRMNIGSDGFVGDIRALVNDPGKIPSHWSGVDFLDGSPPCTMFSSARNERKDPLNAEKKFTEGGVTQRLDDLFFWFLRLAAELRPRVIVAENVIGMARLKFKYYLTQIEELGRSMGYNLRIVQACASRHGAPQLRRRLFFFWTKKRHTELPGSIRVTVMPHEALRCAPDKGEPVLWLTEKKKRAWEAAGYGERVKGAAFAGIRLNPRTTPPALCASRVGPFHWDESRYLTYGECSRMQTFPDDYDFGDQCGQYVCGMSVPPFLTQWAGLYVERLLNA